jgi:glutamate formiminotransferase
VRLIECVPNVSEGRDATVLERIVGAVKGSQGVALLDWSADPDHNRALLTYVGEPEAVLTATQALCREAFAIIDMRKHEGAHPRLGAVDVIPFVPVRGVTDEEAVALARQLGEWIGAQGVPVYYYQEAATRPERQSLPDVRRGEYEGLAAKLATPEWAPDAGPAEFNVRSGASIVGVRFPLIALNVNLATSELTVARRIAEAVRFSGGGYRYLRAMGVALEAKGQVQVAMDILNYKKTPIHRVLETVRSEASRYGVAVAGCELVGLAPMGAFEEVLQHYLQLHDFSVRQIIESRLLEE